MPLAKSRLDRNSEALQYLDKADELSDHLLALINDILDMSRIEAGKVELEKKTFSLRELGNRLYDMFAKQLQERGIHYEVNLEDMTIDSVEGDELRISQGHHQLPVERRKVHKPRRNHRHHPPDDDSG